MHITEIQYFNSVNHHKNAIKPMHGLKTIFDKILQITNHGLKDTLNAEGNLLLCLSAKNAYPLIVKIGFWPS